MTQHYCQASERERERDRERERERDREREKDENRRRKRERERERERTGKRKKETRTKKDRKSSAFLFPLLLRLRLHPRPFQPLSPSRYRPTTIAAPPSSFELPAFCGGSTTSRRSDARRGLVGSHATLPKRYLTWPAVSYSLPPLGPSSCPNHAISAPFHPDARGSLATPRPLCQPLRPPQPTPRPSMPPLSLSSRRYDARSARKTLRVGSVHRPREKIARLCFKR